jgi:hypothetical protein
MKKLNIGFFLTFVCSVFLTSCVSWGEKLTEPVKYLAEIDVSGIPEDRLFSKVKGWFKHEFFGNIKSLTYSDKDYKAVGKYVFFIEMADIYSKATNYQITSSFTAEIIDGVMYISFSEPLYRSNYDSYPATSVTQELMAERVTEKWKVFSESIHQKTIELQMEVKKEELAKRKVEEDELRLKAIAETKYQEALNTPGLDVLVEYIKKNWRDEYFNRDSYIEIARRLTNNKDVKYTEINYINENPYAFEKDIIYFCDGQSTFGITQWMDKGILATIRDTPLFIESVPNIKAINGRAIRNAYMRYKGTTKMIYANGAEKILPVFDILYHFYKPHQW